MEAGISLKRPHLVCINQTKEGNHFRSDFRVVRELSDNEFSEIQSALSRIARCDRDCSVFFIFRDNYKDLVKFIGSFSSIPMFDVADKDDFMFSIFIGANRLFLNYLTSFRMFLDYTETRLKRLNKQRHKKFKEKTAYCFDKRFSYRFLSDFRNYVQHCGLPVGSFNFSGENFLQPEKNKIHFSISSKKLLESGFNWKKEVRLHLEKLNDEIDLGVQARELFQDVCDIFKSCFDEEINQIKESGRFLSDYISEAENSGFEGVPCIVLADASKMKGPHKKGEEVEVNYTMIHFPTSIMNLYGGIEVGD